MRLIDADDLLKQYDKEHEGPPGRARELIENAPTVGETAKWRIQSAWSVTCRRIICNKCTAMFSIFDEDFSKYRYCPNCGTIIGVKEMIE